MRVLLVEDEPKVATFIKNGLEQSQVVVDVARNMAEGDYMASMQAYDVLILDCMLPDGDGRDLCGNLREAGISTPILMLTAKDSTADKVLGLDKGADDYLTKPFDFSELLARVRALGRRSKQAYQALPEVAGLKLEPSTRIAYRSGEQIHLTPKEYQLVEFLLRRSGEVVSRTELLEQIWGFHFDTNSNIVDVFIKILRDKIDRPFETPLIHTVRGFGYVLEDRSHLGESEA